MSESLLPDGMAEAINATVIFPSGNFRVILDGFV
ncbi:unnamed protein product [Haemonchus placei]|uniref:Galectin n=1 Tax=Haemonchus placei TaxID=6290 RepID=A0A0N4XC18_HAEPC|nr:unnamed protein product [Haemonchus placei]